MSNSSVLRQLAPFAWNTAISRGGVLAFALLAPLCISGCWSTSPNKGLKNPKVVATKPITDIVIDYQDFTGRLEAVKTVDLRARVSGYLMAPEFKKGDLVRKEQQFQEGDLVKEGQLLFQIDSRPFKAKFDLAVANLKLAEADKNLMAQNFERADKLLKLKDQAIAQAEYDAAKAALEKSIAQTEAMNATKEDAELFLGYTSVIAPFEGRVSRRFVDPGNQVTADNTILTTIVTEDPMYAYFEVDERTYLELLALIAPGRKSWLEGLKLPVMMRLANDKDFERVGMVDFVDNRVVATTGTVKMRGVFPNSTGRLKAGMFVRIRLPIGSAYKAIVIPDEAIQSDQERKYVWVVNANNEVEYRSVKLGQAIGDLRVILAPEKGKEGKEGLSEDERIIVEGMQRAKKGIRVEVEAKAPPAPPDMPLVRLLKVDRGKSAGAPK
jgi:membrane fusion protein, multidrug efflux system